MTRTFWAGGVDLCPCSDHRGEVTLAGCGTGISNVLLDGGCTMLDLIARCEENVECVTRLAEGWRRSGRIMANEVGRIVSCAAH